MHVETRAVAARSKTVPELGRVNNPVNCRKDSNEKQRPGPESVATHSQPTTRRSRAASTNGSRARGASKAYRFDTVATLHERRQTREATRTSQSASSRRWAPPITDGWRDILSQEIKNDPHRGEVCFGGRPVSPAALAGAPAAGDIHAEQSLSAPRMCAPARLS